MPKTKLELIAECYNAMMLEIYRNDMKVCEYMSKNGNKPVTVQMHSPRQDLIGVLDFHKMREVYKKIRFENNLQTVMDDR